jgi:hypothetical protein
MGPWPKRSEGTIQSIVDASIEAGPIEITESLPSDYSASSIPADCASEPAFQTALSGKMARMFSFKLRDDLTLD